MDQEWFEMRDIRRRKLASAVWIPLRAIMTVEKEKIWGTAGYKKEFFGAGSLAVPLEKKGAAAKELGWSEVGISHNHGGYVDKGRYVPCDIYEHYTDDFQGLHLVLSQPGTSIERSEWHLHQDLVLTLGLKREGDVWVRPEEGYVEVARIHHEEDGSPKLLEIRAEHLKDYLCARQMALYVTTYRQRDFIAEQLDWTAWDNDQAEEEGGDRWEGRILEIDEGGHPFGAETAVFHMSRTDVDPKEEVPTFDFPSDSNVESHSWVKQHKGKKLYRVMGEFWRNEWVEPGAASPRVRGDKLSPTAFFITDASGTRETKETLGRGSRWLWFRPEVIMGLAHRRGGSLGWFTKDTGSVGCSPGCGVHFGINGLGLINVYSKDISVLPDWQQVIWAGYNLSPDGGVSEELLASQMKAKPAATKAPEAYLQKAFELLDRLFEEKLGFRLFREHDQIAQLVAHSHRFRAIDRSGLLSLAKDLARLTADRIDAAAIQKVVSPPKSEKWGSLKSLQNLIASQVGSERAKALMGPLIGIYNLRLGDAHLPSGEISEAFNLARIDQGAPPVSQGYQLMDSCVSTLYEIATVLKEWSHCEKK